MHLRFYIPKFDIDLNMNCHHSQSDALSPNFFYHENFPRYRRVKFREIPPEQNHMKISRAQFGEFEKNLKSGIFLLKPEP